MQPRLLHIFRNTPFGREILLQSLYFCKTIRAIPHIYIPETTKFLLYFEHDAIQVDLDGSYLRFPESASVNLDAITDGFGQIWKREYPLSKTASTLPDISTDFEYICCPRVISKEFTKIGLGHIGPKVRRIVCVSHFPVLIPGQVYKPWNSLFVLFGGSENAARALRLGLRLSKVSGLPLDIFTQAKDGGRPHYEAILQEHGLLDDVKAGVRTWHFFESGDVADNLMITPHDALVLLGAYGHGLIHELMFGSTMELAQSTLPNNLLVTGPRFKPLTGTANFP